MKRSQILDKIKNYFKIEEFVDQDVYRIHGDNAWQFFSTDLLKCILIIREGIGKPVTINNWSWGGGLSQRGLRHNQSDLVKRKDRIYLSAHMMGKALDFDVKGMGANEVRDWIELNAIKFPCKIRLERNLNGKPISWVHLDIYQHENNPQVYQFDI